MSFAMHRSSFPTDAREANRSSPTVARSSNVRTPRAHALFAAPSSALRADSGTTELANAGSLLSASAAPRRGFLGPARRHVRAHGSASTESPIPMQLDRDLETPLPGFDNIAEALEDIKQGKFLLVLDDESRENEGDLIIAASKVTQESMHYLVEYSSGVVCVSMEGKDLERLRLPQMVSSAENEDTMYTAFAITCDLRDGITTGISASDRAKTIVHMANPEAGPADFRRPGHIFPLRYRPGGVLVRPGHTEAAVDLARLAGLPPVGVLCEVVNKADGSMARTPELLKMGKDHGVKVVTIADLVNYRLRHDALVTHTGANKMDTRHGSMQVHTFKSNVDGAEHIMIVAGEVDGQADVLTYLQPKSYVPDALRPSDSLSLDDAMTQIASVGRGVVVCFGKPQDAGVSQTLSGSDGAGASVPSVLECCSGAQMLRQVGVQSVQLLGGEAELVQTLKHIGVNASLAPAQRAAQHVNGANGAYGLASKDGLLMQMTS